MSYGTVLSNPFTSGDTVTIPAGTAYVQDFYLNEVQFTKRATTITVHDTEPGCVRFYDTIETSEEEKEKFENPLGHTIYASHTVTRKTLVLQATVSKRIPAGSGYHLRQYVLTPDLLKANHKQAKLVNPVDLRDKD